MYANIAKRILLYLCVLLISFHIPLIISYFGFKILFQTKTALVTDQLQDEFNVRNYTAVNNYMYFTTVTTYKYSYNNSIKTFDDSKIDNWLNDDENRVLVTNVTAFQTRSLLKENYIEIIQNSSRNDSNEISAYPPKIVKVDNYLQDRNILQTAPEKVFDLQPINYIPTLKNPCFFVEAKTSNETRLIGNMTLKCLPYIFLFGTEKCGTSDLYWKLILHQHVHGSVLKETQFFTNMMQVQNKNFHNGTIGGYNDMFQNGINKMLTDCKWQLQDELGNHIKCPHILIDGTPRYFHNLNGVKDDPLNAGLDEPYILVPHRIKHLLPNAKLILMLRNPTDRILSAYKYFYHLANKTTSIEDFHQYVVNGTKLWNICQNITSERNCVYNFNNAVDILNTTSFLRKPFYQIRIGMYHIYLRDCLAVFPKNNVLIIRFEDYMKNVTLFMEKVLKFLDLEPFSLEAEKLLHAYVETEKVFNKARSGPNEMWPITRNILESLYKKHNLQLADLLNDRNFSWEYESVIQ